MRIFKKIHIITVILVVFSSNSHAASVALPQPATAQELFKKFSAEYRACGLLSVMTDKFIYPRMFQEQHVIEINNAITTGTALLHTLQECHIINIDLNTRVTNALLHLENIKNKINLLIALD